MHGLTVAVLFGLVLSANGACPACDTTYATAKTAAGADNTAKCTALKVYFSCLVSNLNVAACAFDTTLAASINTDVDAATGCATSLDAGCTCLKDFYITDPADSAAQCTSSKALIGCLYGQTVSPCGQTTTVSTIFTNANTYIKALTGPTCSVRSACQCEIDYASTAITSSNNCTAATTLNTCYDAVTSRTETGCVGTCPVSTLSVAATTMKTFACAGASEIRVASLLLLLPLALFKF